MDKPEHHGITRNGKGRQQAEKLGKSRMTAMEPSGGAASAAVGQGGRADEGRCCCGSEDCGHLRNSTVLVRHLSAIMRKPPVGATTWGFCCCWKRRGPLVVRRSAGGPATVRRICAGRKWPSGREMDAKTVRNHQVVLVPTAESNTAVSHSLSLRKAFATVVCMVIHYYALIYRNALGRPVTAGVVENQANSSH